MECRTFELTLESAWGLKLDTEKKKKKKESIYAVAYITGIHGEYAENKFKTRSDKTEGSDPTWNSSVMKFVFDENSAQQNHLTLVVKVRAKRFFLDKKVGEFRFPIKGLLEGATVQGKPVQSGTCQLSGKHNGFVDFKYKFGEVYIQKPMPVAGSRGTTSSSSGFGTGFIGGLMAGGGCGGGGK